LRSNLVSPQELLELRAQNVKLWKDVALVQQFKAHLEATGQEKYMEICRKLEADRQHDQRNSGGKN